MASDLHFGAARSVLGSPVRVRQLLFLLEELLTSVVGRLK